MNKILTKKVYKVTIECKLKNKWADEDGMTWGLKTTDECFRMTLKGIKDYNSQFKSRKFDWELVEES